MPCLLASILFDLWCFVNLLERRKKVKKRKGTLTFRYVWFVSTPFFSLMRKRGKDGKGFYHFPCPKARKKRRKILEIHYIRYTPRFLYSTTRILIRIAQLGARNTPQHPFIPAYYLLSQNSTYYYLLFLISWESILLPFTMEDKGRFERATDVELSLSLLRIIFFSIRS